MKVLDEVGKVLQQDGGTGAGSQFLEDRDAGRWFNAAQFRAMLERKAILRAFRRWFHQLRLPVARASAISVMTASGLSSYEGSTWLKVRRGRTRPNRDSRCLRRGSRWKAAVVRQPAKPAPGREVDFIGGVNGRQDSDHDQLVGAIGELQENAGSSVVTGSRMVLQDAGRAFRAGVQEREMGMEKHGAGGDDAVSRLEQDIVHFPPRLQPIQNRLAILAGQDFKQTAFIDVPGSS